MYDRSTSGTIDTTSLNSALVGLTAEQAVALAARFGWVLRVEEIDGVGQNRTADRRADRINVAITDGEVSRVMSIE